MSKVATIAKLSVAGAFMLALAPAQAADPIKVGVVTPLSGTSRRSANRSAGAPSSP